MKTQIFENYEAFLRRDDLKINGVSQVFATVHPNYEQQNETNEGCWNCSDCFRCSDCYGCFRCFRCSDCFNCSNCYDCSDCSGCSDCSSCSDCSNCYGCSRCSDCSSCSDCSDCSDCSRCSRCSSCSRCSNCSRCSGLKSSNEGDTNFPTVPVIPNIHGKVLEAVSKPEALDMSDWHTCDTTHCRAGWVVVLAGKKGKELEEKTSTLFAAMQIYKASSPIKVPPTRFFDLNEIAMEDMKRCAEEESKIR